MAEKIKRVKELKPKDYIRILRQEGASNLPDLLLPVSEFIEYVLSQIQADSGSSILLQTNGDDNAVQSLLNIVQGTGITIADNGDGSITITNTGSGGSITADNGLTESTGNIQLGGDLIKDTTISTFDFDLIAEGGRSSDKDYIFQGIDNANGNGILGRSVIGTGIEGESVDGFGVYGVSENSVGVNGYSENGIGGNFSSLFSAGLVAGGLLENVLNREVNGIDIQAILAIYGRNLTGHSIGAGVSLDIHAGNIFALVEPTGRIASVFSDVTAFNVAADLAFYALRNNVSVLRMLLKSTGQLQLPAYVLGAFSGTVAYLLAVDSSGNVIVTSASPGGGITSLNLQTGATQTFANGSAGTAPAFNSASDVHTLNIPMASGAGVTAGLVSKAQYDSWIGSAFPYITNFYLGSTNPLDLLVVEAIDRLYIPSNTQSEIRVYVASTGVLLAIISLASVAGVFYINSELWATNTVNGTISRYNATTGASLGTITGSGIRGVAAIYFPATNKAMFANLGSNNVTFINTSTNTVTSTIASAALGGNGANGLALATAGAHNGLVTVVLRAANKVCLINPISETVVTASSNPSSILADPVRIAYNESVDRYFITNNTNQNVVVLNPDSGTTYVLDSVIENVQRGFGIVNDSTNNLLYVAGSNLEGNTLSGLVIYTIDAATKSVIKITPTSLINVTTTFVNNISIDIVNGFIYCNTYGGTSGNLLTAKLKLRP